LKFLMAVSGCKADFDPDAGRLSHIDPLPSVRGISMKAHSSAIADVGDFCQCDLLEGPLPGFSKGRKLADGGGGFLGNWILNKFFITALGGASILFCEPTIQA
jgi:hypothetical protein